MPAIICVLYIAFYGERRNKAKPQFLCTMNNTTTDSKGEEEESRGDPPVEDPPAGKDPPEEEEKEGGSKEPESSDHGPPARSSSEQDAQNKTTEVDAKEDQEKGNETSTPNPEEKADTKIGSNEDSSLAEKKEPSESDIISVKPEENKNSDDVEMVDVEKEKAIVDSEEKTEKKDIHDVEMKDAPASPKPNPNQQPSARTEDTAPETNPQSNTNNNHNHDNETQQREPITMNIIPEENEDDQYDFPESFPVKRKTKPSTRTAAKHKKLKISIRSVSPEQPPATKSSMEQQVQSSDDKKQEPQSHVVPDLLREYRSIGEDMLWPEDNGSAQQELDAELEDSLLFFQDTHEEQDPAYINFIQEREEHALKQKLQQLEAEDAVGRKEIDEAITAQSKDKQILTNRNIEKYQLKAASEEKRDTQRLMQLYNEKVTSNQGRIDQGIKILTRRHQQEMQNAMNQHRQQFQNQQQSLQAQQQWASVAQQLQGKHQRQMNEFQAKGEEMKKKSEKDFQAQQEKLKNQYQMRLREIEASRRKVFAKIFNGFQQLRQRYLKRHSQKIAKKREMILQHSKMVKQQLQKAAGKAPEEVESSEKKRKKKGEESSSEEKQEFMRPPSPVKTSLDWIKEELLVKPDGELSGGSIRHKQRKSVLSQLGKQLSVEIHNEGLWISTFADKSKEGDTNTEDASNRSNGTRNSGKGTSGAANSSSAKPGESGDKNDSKGSETEQEKFIPWGVEAHTILQSIICGEIPRGYHFAERGTDFGDALSVQGGHIRCVVTDLRTNESTASSQRAASIHEQEESNLQGLEQKIVELSSLANEAEATLSRAEAEEKECRAAAEKTASDYEKAKKIQQEFRTKFSGYLGPGE